MKVNYHTHTCRCKHAGGTEEDYVLAAIKSDIKILGFSDHAPFPDGENYGLRMEYSELDDYLNELDRLKEIYSDRITLYKGLEIEYFRKNLNYYEELLTKRRLDYLLLGEHIYMSDNNSSKSIYSADSTECYLEYANAISEGLSTGYFKILAHPDLCMINHFAWDYNCDKAFDIILEATSRYGTIIEFNANGIRRGLTDYPDGKRYPYPDNRFWSRLKCSDIKVIVGSDCHNPSVIWDEAVNLSYKTMSDLHLTPLEDIFC